MKNSSSSNETCFLKIGRSSCVYVCVVVCVWMLLHVFGQWVNVLSMVLLHKMSCVTTSSFLSLLGCQDVSDSNAGRKLRLCCFMCFFLSRWQTCCQSSVYFNSCHTKKSHINSKRHNKLLLWEFWTSLLRIFFPFSRSSLTPHANNVEGLHSCFWVKAVEGALAL